MSLPVLAAVTGSPYEAALVAGLERAPHGITVVRRCVDLPDLLAAAASGTARAALLSADLRRLDGDALARLATGGVAVVGLHTPGDEAAQMRLRQLGVAHVAAADAAPEDIAAAVTAAVRDLASSPRPAPAYSHAVVTPGAGADAEVPDQPRAVVPGTGRLVAVWGPTGAPGRTSVAVGLAGALARAGVPTVLADADVYGGVVAQVLGLLDEAPGLAAAARMANAGTLDLAALARACAVVTPDLRVLTGIARAERWPELRPAALERVWELCRTLAEVTVVDCGFALEQDEELAYDTAAPRRNGATLVTLARADTVLAVGAADPVGVHRLVRGLAALSEAVPGATPRVVLNRVRRSAVGFDPERQLREALDRYAGVRDVTVVPDDPTACDAALRQGRLVAEVAPGSPVALAHEALAADLLGRAVPRRTRGLLRRGA